MVRRDVVRCVGFALLTSLPALALAFGTTALPFAFAFSFSFAGARRPATPLSFSFSFSFWFKAVGRHGLRKLVRHLHVPPGFPKLLAVVVILAVRNVTSSVITGPEAYAFSVIAWLLVVVGMLVRSRVLAFILSSSLPLPFPCAMICAMI